MERKNKRVLIISLIALILVVAGASYAYFSARITGLESASTLRMTAGTLEIAYSEGDEKVLVENIYPREQKWLSKTITLTGNNTTDLKMNYKLGLNIVTNEFANNELSYSLTLTNTEDPNLKGTPIANKTNVGIQNTTGIEWFGEGQFVTGQNQVHEYLLEIFFLDNGNDQNDSQGAIFNASITVSEAGTGNITPAPNGWNDAPAGSLLAGIKANNPTPSTNTPSIPGKKASCAASALPRQVPASQFESFGDITYSDTYEGLETSETSTTYAEGYNLLVGKYISIMNGEAKAYIVNATSESASLIDATYGPACEEKEAILASAEDDYGTSYYYRGAVENNYVSFGDMCWRIVRIDGNGNIKLVLYNYKNAANRTGANASNPCHTDYDEENAAFARYSEDTFTSEFNINNDQNAYVGLKYGTPGSSTYEAEHNGNNKSTILTNLETWYTANLNSVDSKIATVSYCNDKRVVSDTTYDPWETNPTGLGYRQETTYYQTAQRLNPPKTAAPVLTCPEGISRVESKIGLLSADEVAYAGGVSGTPNTSYYLYKNASSISWWTSSPSGFLGSATAWSVNSDGDLSVDINVDISYAVRPVVSLKPSTTITGGTGTQASPFTVLSNEPTTETEIVS